MKHPSVFSSGLIISIDWRLVNADSLSGDHLTNLRRMCNEPRSSRWSEFLTRCLNAYKSFWVNVSAFAITGMRLTRVPRRFMISMSKGLSLEEGESECREETDVRKGHGRVATWTGKVEASMHSEVRLVGPQRLLLLSHIGLVLVVDEVNDGGPRVAVVDVVTKAGSVNNG